MKKNIAKIFVFVIVFVLAATDMMAEQLDTIVVARDGTGDCRNVAEAINKCRALMDAQRVIYIKKGVYKEKLVIPSHLTNIQLWGEDRDSTIITFDDHANINNMGTFNTYTLKVSGREILIRDLTIENNAPQLGQAVALFADGDGQYYYNCRFLGNQDTVYTGPGKATQHFQDCIIEGTTDFIFGPATAYFDNCTIISKKNSYITAAATPKDVEVGYVFTNCYLKAAPGVTKAISDARGGLMPTPSSKTAGSVHTSALKAGTTGAILITRKQLAISKATITAQVLTPQSE